MSWLHIVVIIPFIAAIIVPVIFKLAPRFHVGWLVLIVPLALVIYFAKQYPQISDGNIMEHSVAWIQMFDIHFTVYLDGLALLFSLIITGVGALVVLYSIFYLSKEREALHNFYVYLLLFMGAMLGIVISDNLIVLYLFWELTSISSFLLIAYWYQRERSRYGAQKALLITVLGGFSMLAGFLILYIIGDTFSIRELIAQAGVIADHALFIPAMLLLLLGAFTKSAQFPFHIWLPDAMEAPTPISAYLHSATMVKAGIYLVARFTPIFAGNMTWFWLIVVGGVVTMLWGAVLAMKQTDLKVLLAFSTVSQLGLIMSLLGMGSIAFHPEYSQYAMLLSGATLAAIFHLINHSAFKGALFMIIGILDHETGTRDIRRLGGLMTIMPMSFTMTIIGGLSMAGLPPFAGFLSKEMMFESVLITSEHVNTSLTWLPYAIWIGSIFTFVYSLILILKTFTGKYEPELLDRKPHEPVVGMLISPIILSVITVVLFIVPGTIAPLLELVMQSIVPAHLMPEIAILHWHGINMPLLMTVGVIIIGVLLYVSSPKWSEVVYNNLPQKMTLNHVYNQILSTMESVAKRVINTHMTGFVRDYLVLIFTFLIVTLGIALWNLHGKSFDWTNDAPIRGYEWVLVVILLCAAISVVLARTRLTAIISIGAVGFVISLFYVIFRAPDLALTQLVVETMTTVLFVLCFYYLPQLKKEISRLPFRMMHVLISAGVGITLTLLGLAARSHQVGRPISSYFERAFELAGAGNMVNAILVDFRGFDTMLEILVLFIAGIGVYTLIKMRRSGRDER